jgi:hypothetical protein
MSLHAKQEGVPEMLQWLMEWGNALPIFLLVCAVAVLVAEKSSKALTTKAGRIAFVLSVTGLVGAYLHERLKQERTEQKENEQTRQILERVDHVRLAVELTLDPGNSALNEYGRFLSRNSNHCLREAAGVEQQGVQEMYSFRVSSDGSCLPQDPTLEATLAGFVVDLEIYQDKEASTCDAPKPQGKEPDLSGRFPAALEDGDLALEYAPADGRFILYAHKLERDLYDLAPSGNITSAPDLKDARMFIRFYPLEGQATENYKSIKPARVTIQFISPRYLKRDISADQMTKLKGGNLPSYVYCFQDAG